MILEIGIGMGENLIYLSKKNLKKNIIGVDPFKNGMVYVFELNKKYDIDGGVARNYARFINHSCDPNCEVEITDNHIWISSIKRIKKGSELTYNYGYSFDTDYEEHICKCGSKKCVGYILSDDDWPKLKKNLKKKKK